MAESHPAPISTTSDLKDFNRSAIKDTLLRLECTVQEVARVSLVFYSGEPVERGIACLRKRRVAYMERLSRL